jgi:hypothetical protein
MSFHDERSIVLLWIIALANQKIGSLFKQRIFVGTCQPGRYSWNVIHFS